MTRGHVEELARQRRLKAFSHGDLSYQFADVVARCRECLLQKRLQVEDDDPEPAVAFGLSLEVLSGFWVDGQMTGGGDEGDRGWGVSTRVGL